MSLPAVLITGASGLLGSELAARLAEFKQGWRVLLLTRAPERIPPFLRTPRYTILKGDVRAAELGLSRRQVETVQRSVKEIVHCAADRRLDRGIDEVRATNVAGTENVLRFASECPRLVGMLHVSTVCVAGRNPGRLPEALVTHQARFSNTYQQSKYEAEQVVASWAWRVPVVIARISSMIGEAATGRVRQFHCLHQFLKLFPRCPVPIIPWDREAWIDVVATDWVADSLAWLLHHRFEAGAVWHLCGSTGNSYPVDQMLAETHRIFAQHRRGQEWFPMTPPRLATLEEWEHYLERMRLEGTVAQNGLLRTLNYFLPHLGLEQVNENTQTMALLEGSGIVQPPVQEVYAGVVRWCLETNWGQEAG